MPYDTNQKLRAKIDTRLKRIASINAHLGTDSTEQEKNRAKRKIKRIWLEIKELDLDFYKACYEVEKT